MYDMYDMYDMFDMYDMYNMYDVYNIKQPLSEHLFDHFWTYRAENRSI